MRLALVLRLQPQLRAPSPNLHFNAAVTTAERVHSHNHVCLLCVPQLTDYDPSDPVAEKCVAQNYNMAWDFRGWLTEGMPSQMKPKYWHNQKLRRSGRYANRGGFKKKMRDLYMVSNWDDFFHPDNENGLLAFLCIANACVHMLTTESKDAVTTAIEIPRVHMYAIVLCAAPSPTRNEFVCCCCSSCFASWISEH